MNMTGWTDRGAPGRRLLAGVAVVALALRMWHLGWGLPDLYEEATPLFRAWGFWHWGGQGLDLNPHFFNYPALSFLVQFVLQVAHYGAGFALGVYPDAGAFQAAWASELSRFVLIGRLPGVFCDAATAVISGLLAGRLVSRRAGLVAAIMVAVNPLHIRLSQMIAVDSMLAFFCSAAILIMLDVAQSGGMKRALSAGLLVGLAASTKYTGAVLLAPLVVATVLGLRKDGPRSVGALTTTVLSPVLLACGVFVILNPFVLLDTSSFLRDFGFEQTHMAAGHFGIPTDESTPLYYIADALPSVMGWPALVLVIAGLAWAVRHGDRRWIVVALGFGALLVVPMFWAMRAERYMLPALPGLLLLFAAGLERFYPARKGEEDREAVRESGIAPSQRREEPGRPGGQSGRTWAIPAALVLAIASLVQPLLATARYHASMLEPDTRAGASAWITRNLPRGSAIVLTPAGVNVDSSYIQLPIPYVAVGLEGLAALYDARWYTDMDLLVGSDFDRARYQQEPERYGAFLQFFYDSLATRWKTVWSAEPRPTCQGPRIWLFAPPRDTQRTPFPPDLIARLESVTAPRSLTVFAANLASVLDSRGRGDRARQVRAATVGELLRRFPAQAPAAIDFLASMASHPEEVRAMAR